MTRKRCYPTIILVWLFSLIIAFCLLPVDHRRLFDKDRKILLLQSICLASTTFFIQLLVVSYSYVRIFKSSKKHFYRISAGKNTRKYNENYRGRTKKNFKAIKTIGFVLSACIITLMPNLILLFVNCYHAITNDSGKIHTSVFVA